MIRIHRPAEAPEVLTTRGVVRRREHEDAIGADRDAYARGEKKLEFDHRIYAHESVKTALRRMQHDKCAFCESKHLAVSYGDVEHFRPKAGYCQDADTGLERPGYYWLAYEWSNLLLSCQLCNQRHRQCHFALRDPSKRCRTPDDALGDEEPLFVDPCSPDPETHIGFREHVPIAIAGSERGARTIAALGLKRDELMREREDRLGIFRLLYEVSRRPGPEQASCAELVERMTDADAPYAGMCRAALAAWRAEE